MSRNTIYKVSNGILPLVFIGIMASFAFSVHVVAAGIVPDEVIRFANTARSEAGLEALQENELLTQAAKNKAEDMIKYDYFAHTSPTGVEPWYWIKQIGYRYQAAGENLAINYTNAKEQHAAWMKSETHRANIMSPRYQETGVGVALGKIDGKTATVTVQYFASPLVAAADRVAAVPPVVGEREPAVQGEEERVAPIEPILTPAVPMQQLSEVLKQELTKADMLVRMELALMVVAFIFLLLSILLPPALMLFRAFRQLRQMTSKSAMPELLLDNETKQSLV